MYQYSFRKKQIRKELQYTDLIENDREGEGEKERERINNFGYLNINI